MLGVISRSNYAKLNVAPLSKRLPKLTFINKHNIPPTTKINLESVNVKCNTTNMNLIMPWNYY